MRIIKILVIDDDSYIAQHMSNLLKKKLLVNIVSCLTLQDAIVELKRQTFDLIFLDLSLGDDNGVDLLKIASNLPSIIILSSSDGFALNSYEYHNIKDYLLKPINEVRLLKAVNRAIDLSFNEKTIEHPDFIFVKVGRKVQRFEYKKIDYFEAYGIYSKIFEGGKMILVNESISYFEAVLPKNLFMRIHKSYIVNISQITSYDTRNLYIGDWLIPVGGETYRKNLEGIIRLLKGDNRKTES